MKINSLVGVNFKNNSINSTQSQKQNEYNFKRRELIKQHSYTTDNLCYLMCGDVALDIAYRLKDKKRKALAIALQYVLPFIVTLPFMTIEYCKAAKLNKEYRSEELKNKTRFERFKFNYLTLLEDKPKKNHTEKN